jgi:hypothetical protein
VLTSRGCWLGGLRPCSRTASEQTCLVFRLEEAAGQLRVMRDEKGALGDLTFRARGPVLRGSDEVPTETQVNAAAINGVQWGPDWH